MAEIRIKDFDDFRQPNRRPWLLLIFLVIVAFIFVQRHKAGKKVEIVPEERPIEKPVTVVKKRTETEAEKVEPSNDVSRLLTRGKALENARALVEARKTYLELLKQAGSRRVRVEAERCLGRINAELILTPRPMPPEKVIHLVKSGDSVEKIARKFGTTVELIQKNNPQIRNPNLIKAGDRLKVFTGKFAITISKKRNDMVVYMNKEFFKRYRVGTGKYNTTPAGTFTINERIKEPVWWRRNGKEVPYTGKPDGENILGTRWLTLRAMGDTPDARGYGIHGTWDDNTVGKWVSAGCIRLTNSDIEQIFTMVPLGTPVTITE